MKILVRKMGSFFVKRWVKLIISVLCFYPVLVLALTVGPISAQSFLDQPFDAVIPLRNIDDLDSTQIKVKLLDFQGYDKIGGNRSGWMSELQFQVIKENESLAYILVSSPNPVKEPIVDLVMDISWPMGKVVRQYTILLDPSDSSHHKSIPTALRSETIRAKLQKNALVSTELDQPQVAQEKKPLKILSAPNEQTSTTTQAEGNARVFQDRLQLLQEELDALRRNNELIAKQNDSLKETNQTLMSKLTNNESELKTIKSQVAELNAPKQIDNLEKKVALSETEQISQPTLMTDSPVEEAAPISQPVPAPVPVPTPETQTHSTSWLLILLGLFSMLGGGIYLLWKRKPEYFAKLVPVLAHYQSKLNFNLDLLNRFRPRKSFGLDIDMDKALSVVDGIEQADIEPNAEGALKAKLGFEKIKKLYHDRIERAEKAIREEHFSEAEDILLATLSEAPNHWLAVLCLLELYVTQSQSQQFNQWLEKLPVHLEEIDREISNKVLILKERMSQSTIETSGNSGDFRSSESGYLSGVYQENAIQVEEQTIPNTITEAENELRKMEEALTKKEARLENEEVVKEERTQSDNNPLEFVLKKKPKTPSASISPSSKVQSAISLAQDMINKQEIEAAKVLLQQHLGGCTSEERAKIEQLLASL